MVNDATSLTGRIEQDPRRVVANPHPMDAHDRLIARVAGEQDDVLNTLQLCRDDKDLEDRLWTQLVDLLVESMFLDLRRSLLSGQTLRDAYVQELTDLAERCRATGLLPLPARGI
jgi:hypothetical protein